MFAGCRPSHLTVIAGPAGHVLLWLHVAAGAQGLHPGLGDDRAHDFTLHGDERIPVARDLLVRSQLQLTGEGMGMIHSCGGKSKRLGVVSRVPTRSATPQLNQHV